MDDPFFSDIALETLVSIECFSKKQIKLRLNPTFQKLRAVELSERRDFLVLNYERLQEHRNYLWIINILFDFRA